jgi:uncharacterized protein (DUF305 family)
VTRHHPARSRPAVLVGVLAGLVLTASCSGTEHSGGAGPDAGPAGQQDAVRVIQPGRPGEAAREVAEPAEITVDDAWNHADVMFMQMMIPHHGQALEMSRLAKRRARDPRVRTLAERIHAAQGPEIRVMADWLAERGVEVPRAAEDARTHDHAKHGHAGMEGMLTDAQMNRLAASRGARFDRLFLTGMIEHHRGAVAMVDEIVPDGTDTRVRELADDMATAQLAEIARLQDVRDSLPS